MKKKKQENKQGKEEGSIIETRKGELENVENSEGKEYLTSDDEK